MDTAAPIAMPPSASPAMPVVPQAGPVVRAPQALPESDDRTARKSLDEERQQRRLRRNVITASLCLALLLIVMAILLKLGG